MKEILDHLMWTISNNVPCFLWFPVNYAIQAPIQRHVCNSFFNAILVHFWTFVAQLYVLQASSTFPTPLSCAGRKGTCPNPRLYEKLLWFNDFCVCDEKHRRTVRFVRDPMILSITPSWNWVPRQKTRCVGSGLRLKHEHLVLDMNKQTELWDRNLFTSSNLLSDK